MSIASSGQRVAVLSDVHGNAVALEAVLTEPVELLVSPPSRRDVIQHAESLRFSG